MSEQEREHIEDLIGKYIFGEASQTEKSQLEKWALSDPANQKYLEDAQLIFEKSQLEVDASFDADLAWGKVKPQLATKSRQLIFPSLWKVAASFVLFAGLAYFLYYQFAPGERQTYYSGNEVRTELIANEAEITLNKGAEMVVDYNSRKKTGIIELQGEATISISEDKKSSWLVQTGELLIRDIGTVFHVKALPDQNEVEVSVFEGEVQFYSAGEEGIHLLAGEKGVYSKSTREFVKAVANENVLAYKTRSFGFEDQRLEEVVAQLNQVYDQKIIIQGGIAQCKITVGFVNEDLETILDIISETIKVDIARNGEQIILSGETCF
ncbi:FecR family protein [Algoriphagus vanfongensis]|uniref:FecR family protein n=1 Tax=Algoriphagus vanfongensis TaxID=426371 RepID=UPI0004112318|nr:FecR domain-containing protein [Algoriphagus vanfongensis]